MATRVNGRDPKVEEHLRISRQFLRQAEREFARGDRLQASEKAWGAAAHAVKAVAQQRGWRHDGHRYLFEAIDKVYCETGDSEFLVLFKVANSLHTNFYENWQTDNLVQDGIERVEALLAKLEPLTA
ncbi:MAG: PaREP1 family protein [Chloroflexota bacterium]|nr:PaREP1 family protein [Chloroflexota bacterium]MDE2930189.1 PaREP1 family protein [Chloroflexota bacterium]